jgi:LysM repeat protein
MIAALALAATIYVQPGQTLSGIAAANGTSLGALEAANPQISDPNVIYVGEAVNLSGGGSAVPDAAPAASSGTSAPSGFQACVINAESSGNSQVMNSSGHYGLYQFSASTWAEYGGNPGDFGDASVSEQNQVFNNAMAAGGEYNWAPYDGC